MQPIDQRAFMVALEENHFGTMAGCHFREFPLDLGQRARAIDAGLACAEQVQIGSIKDKDARSHRCFLAAPSCRSRKLSKLHGKTWEKAWIVV